MPVGNILQMVYRSGVAPVESGVTDADM